MKNTKTTIHLEKFYKNHKFNQLEKPVRLGWKTILLNIILALIFGFLAGLSGGLFVLITRSIKIPFYKELNLDEMLPKREIVIKTREVVNVLPNQQRAELIKQSQGQVVKIFLKKPEAAVKKILEQIYQDEETLGQGFVLTNDGWIISHREVISDFKKEYLICASNKMLYPVEKILIDPLTGVIFLKIEAEGLEVVKLGEKEDIALGEEVLVADGANQVKIREITKIQNLKITKTEDLIESSDKLSRFVQINQGLADNFKGAPVTNLKGSIIGILIKGKEVEVKNIIPVNYFKSLINQILKEGKNLKSGDSLKRPSLGVNYLDLAQARGITDKRFKDLKRGALVWGPPLKESAAFKAEIKNADVILKVNNDLINGRSSLTELIQEYKPNDKIILTILREGKEEKIEVELETLDNNSHPAIPKE